EIRTIFLTIDMISGTTKSVASLMDITEQKKVNDALNRANKKLNLLNHITFSDIQNSVFSLFGTLEMKKRVAVDEELRRFLDNEIRIVQSITKSLKYASQYQNLGLKPPGWQNVMMAFLYGISHIDLLKLSRKLEIKGLEIYA